jgi:hypothetical protein
MEQTVEGILENRTQRKRCCKSSVHCIERSSNNLQSRTHLGGITENTILSFVAAAKLGANYVEFDVIQNSFFHSHLMLFIGSVD